MRGTVRATEATVHAPSDSVVIAGYPIGYRRGGTDASQSGTEVVAWKTAGGGADKTCVISGPVGETVPVEGFYKILSTGTTLPATGGQIVVFFGPLQR